MLWGLRLKAVKRVDFKSSHEKKKLCMVTDTNQTNCGEHFTIFTNIESLHYTPETGISSTLPQKASDAELKHVRLLSHKFKNQ